MNELALFAGAGGGILGGHLLGWRTICAVEWEPYPASVLCARQNDGVLPPFPIWDDVRTFDGRPWRGRVDVVSGGFPCQDISAAGKGAGIEGERSGMWKEMARIIREVGPSYVFVENSPMLTSRGLGQVLGDLAALGYHAAWGVLGAADVGAPHRRDRIWIVGKMADASQLQRNGRDYHAGIGLGEQSFPESGNGSRAQALAHANSQRRREARELRPNESAQRIAGGGEALADAHLSGCEEQRCPVADGAEHQAAKCGAWWATEPDLGRVAHGVAARVDRLKAIGNGQVSGVAAVAFSILSARLK
jgi:DNA (cytosine-5)-methyltransferase 1